MSPVSEISIFPNSNVGNRAENFFPKNTGSAAGMNLFQLRYLFLKCHGKH